MVLDLESEFLPLGGEVDFIASSRPVDRYERSSLFASVFLSFDLGGDALFLGAGSTDFFGLAAALDWLLLGLVIDLDLDCSLTEADRLILAVLATLASFFEAAF